jgi:hypothetical protein
MPPKKNPLGLNKLQLKALTLLQAYAETGQGVSDETDGEMTITVPPPHGDHFHVGEYVVFLKDATGLINKGVWAALERKGLIKPLVFPTICTLTWTGVDYDTGVRDSILHRSGH